MPYKDIDIEFLSNFSSFSAFTSLKIHTKTLSRKSKTLKPGIKLRLSTKDNSKKKHSISEIILTEMDSAFKILTIPQGYVFFVSLISSEFTFNNHVLRILRL